MLDRKMHLEKYIIFDSVVSYLLRNGQVGSSPVKRALAAVGSEFSMGTSSTQVGTSPATSPNTSGQASTNKEQSKQVPTTGQPTTGSPQPTITTSPPGQQAPLRRSESTISGQGQGLQPSEQLGTAVGQTLGGKDQAQTGESGQATGGQQQPIQKEEQGKEIQSGGQARQSGGIDTEGFRTIAKWIGVPLLALSTIAMAFGDMGMGSLMGMTIGLLGTLYGFGIFEQLGIDVDGMIASFFGGAGGNTGGKGGTQPAAVLSPKQKQALESAEGKQASDKVRGLLSSFDQVIDSGNRMTSEQIGKPISQVSRDAFQDTREGAALMGMAANGLSLLYEYAPDDNLKANIAQLYRQAFIDKDQRALQAAIGLMYDFVMGVYSSGPQVLEGRRVPSYSVFSGTTPISNAIKKVFELKAGEVVANVRNLNELKEYYARRNLSVIEIRKGLETVINGNIAGDNKYGSLHGALLGLMAGLGDVKSYLNKYGVTSDAILDKGFDGTWDSTWYNEVAKKSYLRGLLNQDSMRALLEKIAPDTNEGMSAKQVARNVLSRAQLLDLLHLNATTPASQQAQQLASSRGQQGQVQQTTGQRVQTNRT